MVEVDALVDVFSTSSCLEIYSLNLAESGHDMPCLARQDTIPPPTLL